jgi:hypothetical protein
MNFHDSYRPGASQNLAYAAAGGSSAASTAFGPQTFFIRLSAVGLVDSTNTGCRYAIGSAPVATASSVLLPLNWVGDPIKVTPGQKVAAISNSASIGSLSITELDG